jgi:hypothetical protein
MKWNIPIIVTVVTIFLATSISITPDAVDMAIPAMSISFVSPDAFAFVAWIGAVISQEPLIYRNGISLLLKETLGIKLGKSTIAKLFSPAVGQGCEPACYWNKRPLYRPADVIAWAKSRLRPGPGMTAISAEEMPADDIPAKGSEPAARTTDPHL